MKNKLFSISLLVLFTIGFAMTPVFANELENTTDNTIVTNTVNTIDNGVDNPVDNTVDNTVENNGVNNPTLQPVTTFDELVSRIVMKLNEILGAIKVIAEPVILILFIVAAITSLFGALSKKGSVWKGVGAMVVAGLVFSAILYADVIVSLFTTWLVS